MDDKYLLSIRRTLLDCSHIRCSIDVVLNCLNDFEQNLRALKPINNRDKFVDDNMTVLTAIRFELGYLIKENHVATRKQELIRLRDKLFGSLLRKVELFNERTKVTKIFNEFVKGITYYNNEKLHDNNQPIYHREGACSKKGLANIPCVTGNLQNTRKKKANDIRKCYIERLIYDNLWTRLIFSSQDIDHIKWLDDTKNAYKTCFPDIELHIDIVFDEENNIPYCLTVYEGDVQEIYEKPYDKSIHDYIYPVNCTKYDSAGSIKHKYNFFSKEGSWH